MAFKLPGLLRLTLKCLFTVLCGSIVCFFFAHELFKLAELPLVWSGMELSESLRSASPFNRLMAALRLSFYASLTITGPLLLHFLSGFFLPAYGQAKARLKLNAILVGAALYFSAAWIAFAHLAPALLSHFRDSALRSDIAVVYDPQSYYFFLFSLCISAGLACELPVFLGILQRFGIATFHRLSRLRPYVATALLVLAAVAVPALKIVSIAQLALPILAAYELSIWIVYFLEAPARR